MSPRMTLPRRVAMAQQTTPDRHVATDRQAALRPTASAETTQAASQPLERARARTLPRMLAMAQPVIALVDERPAPPPLRLVHTVEKRASDRERWDRRLLNIAAAAVGLVLAFSLMLVIAALIKLTSRGPVLFAQTRVGLDRRFLTYAGGNTRRHIDQGGHPFTMY